MAGQHLAGVDADAQLGEGVADLGRRANGAERVVLVRRRHAEDAEELVTGAGLHGATVQLDDGPRLGERAHRPQPQPLGVEPFLGRSELAEDDGDRLPPLLDGRQHGGEIQLGILTEDRLMQLPQLDARLDPELLHERLPRIAIGVERIGLPPRPVEREHELSAQALAEAMLEDERLELGHEVAAVGRARARRR